jgi:RNA polymerase sigma factor (sigma-70 family)
MMKMNTKNIDEIFNEMRFSKNNAIEELYKTYYKTIYGTALSVCHDREKSKDIVHNVIMRLYTLPIDKLPSTGGMSWLYAVTKNEALQFLRREKNEESLPENFDIPIQHTEIDDLIDMEHFNSLISGLGERQREIVTLRFVAGLTFREIADELGMKAGTVRWLYSSAIIKLRTKICVSAVLSVLFGASFAYKLYSDLTVGDEEINVTSLPLGSVSATSFVLGAAFILSLTVLCIYIIKAANRQKLLQKDKIFGE